MRPLHKWLALALPAALAAVVAGTAPAANAAQAAAAPNARGAAASAPQGKIHIIHRGLVHDCEYIELNVNGLEIKGNGVNNPVTISTPPGNCWNLYNEFTVVYGTTVYTGYEYQNGEGHCLWDDGTVIDVGAACKAGHPNESFFGIVYIKGGGWVVGDVTEGPDYYMAAVGCSTSAPYVTMQSQYVLACNIWNFPQG
jgi:hypothetical protein